MSNRFKSIKKDDKKDDDAEAFIGEATYRRSNIEKSKKEPTQNVMFRLTQSVNDDIDDLTLLSKRTTRSVVVRAAIKAFKGMTDNEKRAFIETEKID